MSTPRGRGRLFLAGLSLSLLLTTTSPAAAIYGLGDAANTANQIINFLHNAGLIPADTATPEAEPSEPDNPPSHQ